ncbi:hypothetical protein [Asaia prunellae]
MIYEGRSLSPLPTRDAMLPMLSTLVAARQSNQTLAALTRSLPPRFTLSNRLVEMPTARSQEKIDLLRRAPEEEAKVLGLVAVCGGGLSHMDETDGVRMTFASEEIIHLRPSGNAPELRVYVEADTQSRAEELLAVAMNAVACWRTN